MKPKLIPVRLVGITLAFLAIAASTSVANPPARPRPMPMTEEEKLKAMEAVRRATIQAKLDQIMVPSVALSEVTVKEAVDYLRTRSIELDTKEKDPNRKGINFIIIDAKGSTAPQGIASQRMINELKISNVPLSAVLKYVCELGGLKMHVDSHAVILR